MHLVYIACLVSLAYAQIPPNTVFRMAAIQQEPVTFYNPNATGNDQWTGLYRDFMDAIIKRLNKNISYTLYTVTEFGGPVGNGSFNGLVGEIQEGRADMGFGPLTTTEVRREVIDFAAVYQQVGASILVLKPTRQTFDMWSFFRPFTTQLWITIVAICWIVSLLTFVMEHLSPFAMSNVFADQPEHDSFTFTNTIFNTLTTLLSQGGNKPQSWATRIVLIPYWFFVLIILSSYTANLAAFLTTSSLPSKVNGFNDLYNSQFAVVNNSVVQTQIRIFYPDLVPNMVPYPTLESAREAVLAGTVPAFVHAALILKYIANTPPCDTLTVGEEFLNGYWGIPIASQSPYSKEIELAAQYVIDSQQYDTMVKHWINKDTCSSTVDEGAPQLDLDNFSGLFILLGAGAIIGIVILFAELFLVRLLKSGNSKKKTGLCKCTHSYKAEVAKPSENATCSSRTQYHFERFMGSSKVLDVEDDDNSQKLMIKQIYAHLLGPQSPRSRQREMQKRGHDDDADE